MCIEEVDEFIAEATGKAVCADDIAVPFDVLVLEVIEEGLDGGITLVGIFGESFVDEDGQDGRDVALVGVFDLIEGDGHL